MLTVRRVFKLGAKITILRLTARETVGRGKQLTAGGGGHGAGGGGGEGG